MISKSVIKVVRNQQEGGKFFTVGEMYFNLPQLQTRLEQIGRVTKDGEKKLQGGVNRIWTGYCLLHAVYFIRDNCVLCFDDGNGIDISVQFKDSRV